MACSIPGTSPSPRLTWKSPSSGDEGLFHGLPYYSTSMSGSKLRILAVRTRRPPLLARACRGAISTRRRSPYGTPDDSVRQAGGKVVPGLGLGYNRCRPTPGLQALSCDWQRRRDRDGHPNDPVATVACWRG